MLPRLASCAILIVAVYASNSLNGDPEQVDRCRCREQDTVLRSQNRNHRHQRALCCAPLSSPQNIEIWKWCSAGVADRCFILARHQRIAAAVSETSDTAVRGTPRHSAFCPRLPKHNICRAPNNVPCHGTHPLGGSFWRSKFLFTRRRTPGLVNRESLRGREVDVELLR